MRTFGCLCSNCLFFESTECTRCGRKLGYDADLCTVIALDPGGGEAWIGVDGQASGRRYRLCANTLQHQVCNWLVAENDPTPYCRSCRLNEIIPNLSTGDNLRRWQSLEGEKRRLLHTLLALGLDFEGAGGQSPLSFEFLEDQRTNPLVHEDHVTIGHQSGRITINVVEADPHYIEKSRDKLKQPYRTLLGHFRHESGHYYWERLIAGTDRLQPFRDLFGDESIDYAAALENFYARPPLEGWHANFVSAYAQAHPFEDWAESWAHFLHMVDTLETAREFGVGPALTLQEDFDEGIQAWMRVTVMLNELNRSMGLRDAYPFVLTAPVVDKLRFIRNVVLEAGCPS